MHSLRVFSKDEAPKIAKLAAEGIARELLPAAHRRCDEFDAELEVTRAHLEQLRRDLAEEIEQVRREKARRNEASRQKHLDLEVEG
jgi:ABC-type Zn uptake system ZnuABC Zn-binding protein ZnuA